MAVTMKDIARLANVSTTTVSRVINNKTEGVSVDTKNKILDLIKKFDYKPNIIARCMITKKSNTIGLIIPDITNPFFPDIARGVEDGASEHSYNVFLSNTDDNYKKELQCISVLKEKYVDGIVFTSSLIKNTEHILDILKSGIPVVIMERKIDMDNYYGVFIDNIEGGYLATKHLIEYGHKKIAYLMGNIEMKGTQDRLEGYKKALHEEGIPFDESLVMNSDYSMKSGMDLMRELMKRKKIGEDFTAVLTGNDIMACGVYKVIREEGFKIPDDISIVGYDNITFSQMLEPPLTTINQPAYEMGRAAVSLLIKQIEKKRINKKINVFEPNLVISGSTGRIK